MSVREEESGTISFRDGDAHQTQFAHFLDLLLRIQVLSVGFSCQGLQFIVGEIAARFLQHLVRFRQ